jgi:hypothetical protein
MGCQHGGIIRGRAALVPESDEAAENSSEYLQGDRNRCASVIARSEPTKQSRSLSADARHEQDCFVASLLTRNWSPLSLRGRLAEAIPFVTSHRQLVTNGIASAKRPRNDRMLPLHPGRVGRGPVANSQ